MKKEFLCGLAIIVLFTIFNSCSKQGQEQQYEQQLTQQHVGNNKQGVIYIESNAPGQNSIISYFQNSNGTLTYLATTASGGAGTGTALNSQGALALDETHNWLFAVNAGSNSISSFDIGSDGSLTLVDNVSSGGSLPISLSVFGNWLYVVNSNSGNIAGFEISSTGKLIGIAGSIQTLTSSSCSPAQILFTRDRHLIVTEKNADKILTFPVTTTGVAEPGLISSSSKPTPFGFGISGNHLVVAHTSNGQANISAVSTYAIASYGSNNAPGGNVLIPSSASMNCGQTNASRVAATRDGIFAYVTNLGSNSISSFTVNFDGSMQVMKNVEAITGTAPADIAFSDNENYLYTINTAARSISQYKKSPNGRLSPIGEIGGLPASATGLVAL